MVDSPHYRLLTRLRSWRWKHGILTGRWTQAEVERHRARGAEMAASLGIVYREPSSPESVQQTVYGPKIKGYCSECQGPMEQAVSGVSWHNGPCCHWHKQGTDCCRFIPLPAAQNDPSLPVGEL